MRYYTLIAVLLTAACQIGSLPPEAPPIDRTTCQHAWGDFHLAHDSMSPVVENATHYEVEFDKLNAGSPIQFRPDGLGFKITIEYGGDANSGWLGLASVQAFPGGHIVSGKVTMNRTLLDRLPDPASPRVLSQELGHLAGLDHQRGVGDSAMEDCVGRIDWLACITNGATGFNPHDIEQLNIIYEHTGQADPVSPCGASEVVVHAFPVEGAGDGHGGAL